MSEPLHIFEFYDDTYGKHRPGEGMWEAAMLCAVAGFDHAPDGSCAWCWIDSKGVTHISLEPPMPPWVLREHCEQFYAVPQRIMLGGVAPMAGDQWVAPHGVTEEGHPVWLVPDSPCGYTLTPEGYSEAMGLPMQFHGY